MFIYVIPYWNIDKEAEFSTGEYRVSRRQWDCVVLMLREAYSILNLCLSNGTVPLLPTLWWLLSVSSHDSFWSLILALIHYAHSSLLVTDQRPFSWGVGVPTQCHNSFASSSYTEDSEQNQRINLLAYFKANCKAYPSTLSFTAESHYSSSVLWDEKRVDLVSTLQVYVMRKVLLKQTLTQAWSSEL